MKPNYLLIYCRDFEFDLGPTNTLALKEKFDENLITLVAGLLAQVASLFHYNPTEDDTEERINFIKNNELRKLIIKRNKSFNYFEFVDQEHEKEIHYKNNDKNIEIETDSVISSEEESKTKKSITPKEKVQNIIPELTKEEENYLIDKLFSVMEEVETFVLERDDDTNEITTKKDKELVPLKPICFKLINQ